MGWSLAAGLKRRSALAAVRFVDNRWLDGRTAEGAPATAADLGRHVVGLVAVAGGLWVLAHLAARLGWMRQLVLRSSVPGTDLISR